MPLTYVIRHAEQTVVVRGEGLLTSHDFRVHVRERAADPNYDLGMNTLYDLREATISGDLRELHQIAFFMETVEVPSRTAIVASRASAFGVARMFELLTGRSMVTYRAFDDMAAALTWLDLPQDFLTTP